ncbi:MAG TPA: murein biosynthesis integral membrane protein MurJ [Gaiellaceae bacterium]|nr:murein biosynthesis integral membrane protein MurJ [Gaiellaceae bacterium]
MSDADRERELRRLEREQRRRASGHPGYFRDVPAYASAGPDDPTLVLRPGDLPPPRDTEETDQFTTAETTVIPPADAPDEDAPPRRLAVSTAIFAAATALSRVLGVVREAVAAYYFGVKGPINAFTIAFQLPNLVRALVADAALSSAFVPVFIELMRKDPKRAWRVASSLFWLMLLALTALSALFIVVAPWVIPIFGDPGHDRALAVGLSRVLFPIVALLGVSGIIVGILNSYDHFTVPAVSPVFWNVAIVAGLALGVPQADAVDSKLYVYAVSILIATFIQAFLPLPWLRGRDDRLRLVLDWRDPAVKRVFVNMVPVTLGLGLINVNAVIDMLFASRIIDPNLAPTAIQKAFLVYMLPQGMFSVAIATVLFPTLSRRAAEARETGAFGAFRETVSIGLRQIAFLLVPAAAVSAVLAEPIIRILFQRGEFTPAQTPVVASALAAFSAGLVFNGAMLMLNRAFFSLQSNWVPTAIALGNLFLNGVLDWILGSWLGIWGIPLATAICNVAGAWALLVVLRGRIRRLEGAAIASTVVRVVVASAVVAAVAWTVWRPLDDALGRSFPAQVVSLGTALAAAIAVYLVSCRLLQVREMDALLSLRARLRRA